MADKKEEPAVQNAAPVEAETEASTVQTLGHLVGNALKAVGETYVPGASLLADGKLVEGGVHAVLGIAAKAFLGAPGLLLVAANSYSKSVTGKHLKDHLGLVIENLSSTSENE